MTADGTPAGVVQLAERPSGSHPHPLATRSGIELFGQILAAWDHWEPLTKRQRQVLSIAWHAALDTAVADGLPVGAEVELPHLVGRVHPKTVTSLVRRGLVVDGALTPLAVEVVRLAEPMERTKATAREKAANARHEVNERNGGDA